MAASGHWLVLLSMSAVLAADQALKRLLLNRDHSVRQATLGPKVGIEPIGGRLTMAGRVGVSGSFLVIGWLVLLVAVLAGAGPVAYFQSPPAHVALGAALGGAAGNLCDVVVRKGVVDYVHLGPWPTFNLADFSIVFGIILAFVTA